MNQKGFVNVVLVIVIVALAAAAGYFILVKKISQQTGSDGQLNATAITVSGEVTCLPHRDKSGSGTRECANGLRGTDGKYYGLTNLNQQDLVTGKIANGQQIQVSGILSSDLSSPQQKKYDIVGSIKVESYTTQTGIGSQPEDPNKIGLAPYPDLPITSRSKEPVSIKFIIEHRSALNGTTMILVRGVIVGTLLGEKACPSNGLVEYCAQPSIFLADTADVGRNPLYDLRVLVKDEKEQEKNYPFGGTIEMQVYVAGSRVAITTGKIY